MIDGNICLICGGLFEKPHGKPVVCKICFPELGHYKCHYDEAEHALEEIKRLYD